MKNRVFSHVMLLNIVLSPLIIDESRNIQNPVHTQALGTWGYGYSPQCDTGIYPKSPHIQLTIKV